MSEVRNDCLNLIMSVLEDKKPSHIVIADYLKKHDELARADKNFVKKTVQGVVERAITLDYVINSVAKTKTDKQKPVIRNILRMGAYQILYMDVPDRAACNEAVELAKKRKFVQLTGFINGILRSIIRQKDEYTSFDSLSVQYSMPQWIVDYYLARYTKEQTVTALNYYLSDNLTSIRCNCSMISPSELRSALEAKNIEVIPTSLDETFKITGYGSLAEIDEFRKGLFVVQDISSVLSGEQAEIKAGYRILDLCAAPGGKSLHAADRLALAAKEAGSADCGHVLACDVSEAKKSLIDENIKRCGFKNITAMVNDATVFAPDFENRFDVVICDVPCSGIGIIGKKPDIKYNMTAEGQNELVGLQRRILDNAVRYVKIGGQMVFSTCTVNVNENEDNVRYLESKGLTAVVQRQLLPGEIGCDGFFFALLRK